MMKNMALHLLIACSLNPDGDSIEAECSIPCQRPLDDYEGEPRTLEENEAICAAEDSGRYCWEASDCGTGSQLLGPESEVGSHRLANYFDADGSLVAVAYYGDIDGACIEGSTLNTLWGEVPECVEACTP